MDARYLLRSLAQGFMGKEQPEHKDLGKGVGRPTGVRGQPGDAALLVRTLGAGREVEHGAGPEPGALFSRPTRTSTPAEHMEAQTGTRIHGQVPGHTLPGARRARERPSMLFRTGC